MSIKGRVYGNSYDIIGISVRHEFCEDADTKTGFDHGHDGVIIVESVGDMGFDSFFERLPLVHCSFLLQEG